MKKTVRDFVLNEELLPPYTVESDEPCIMSIDGSTSVTGVSILGPDERLLLSCAFKREPYLESPVRYKIALKSRILDLLLNYRHITDIVYEEPVLNQISAIQNLYMLRSMAQEVLIENEDKLGHINYYEVSNSRWKKIYLAPLKASGTTEEVKKLIADRFALKYPELTGLTQDEKDAYGIGVAFLRTQDKRKLESKKNSRIFKYETFVTGIPTRDITEEDIISIAGERVPEKVFRNGWEIIDTVGRKDFDKEITEHMLSDDKLLVFRLQSGKLGSLLLRFKLAQLSKDYPFIAILVWRTNRKYKVKYKY